MACSSCGKKSTRSITVVTKTISPTGHKEGDDGWLTIVYTGVAVATVRGKHSNKIYLFGVGAIRKIDKHDAEEFDKLRDFHIQEEPRVARKTAKKVVIDDKIQASASEEDSR